MLPVEVDLCLVPDHRFKVLLRCLVFHGDLETGQSELRGALVTLIRLSVCRVVLGAGPEDCFVLHPCDLASSSVLFHLIGLVLEPI